MSTPATAQTYESRLAALVDSRMQAARDLAATAAIRDERRVALEAADADYAASYAGALAAGWTDKELAKAGLDATEARPARRRVARAIRPAATARSADPTQAPAAADDENATVPPEGEAH